MKAVFLWIFLMAGVAGTAKRAADFFKIPLKGSLEKMTLSLGLGLGFLAYVVFILGSLGLLYRPLFLCLGAVFFITGFYPFREMGTGVWMGIRRLWGKSNGYERGLMLLIFAVSGLALCGALAPAIGQDELCYHLRQPKNYVHAHTVYEVPYSSNSLWPYLMHMLFTLGLLLEGDSLAKLFHFSTYLLSGAAIFSFLKREAGVRAALFGGAVYLLTPVAFVQASFGYVDNALSFFVFLSFYAFYFFLKEKNSRWAVLSGIFAGFAVSVKIIGLFILPLFMGAVLFGFFRTTDKKAFVRGVWGFPLAFLACGGLWYARAWILRGNPVYPFHPEFFGGHGWTDPTYLSHGGVRGGRELLFLPWDLTLHPERFGGEHVGVLYLAVLPLLILKRPWPAWLRAALFFGAGYALICFKMDPNVRFFLPALTFLACAAAFWMDAAFEEPGRAWRLAIGVLCGLLFLVQSTFAAYHFRDAFFLLFNRQRVSYLQDKERSYTAAQIVNHFLTPGDVILSVGEIRGYYFDNPFVLEADFHHMADYASKVHSGRQLADYLKEKGFSYVLDTDIAPDLDLSDPEFCIKRFLKEGTHRGDYFKEALRIQSGKTHYTLFRIT